MANITSAGTGNSNAGATWTGGSVPTSSDNAIIQNGHTVTQNAAHTFKSLKVESGGVWTADGSNHLTLSGEDDNHFAFRIQGTYNHANGTVVINNGGGGISHAAVQGGVATSTTGLYDLTISGGGTTCEIFNTTTIHRNMEAGGSETVLRGALTVNGSLTVGATLTTIFSSTSHNLTVTGDASVTGTLTGNASAISLGSLTINSGGTYSATSGTTTITDENSSNYAIQNNGTFTHNSGTVSIETADHTSMAWSSANQRFNNLTINLGASARSFTQASGIGDTDNKYIEGALQIINSTYNVNNLELRVDGDVTLSTNAVLNGATGDVKFGTLKVESGTTYNATSGTTSLNAAGQGHSGNPSAMEIVSGGTFTHNNGTIKFNGITDQDIEMDGTGNFYNLTLDKTNNDVIMHPNVTIENNLDVTLASDHTLRPASTSNTVTVLNQTILRAGQIGATTAYDANHNWGTLTILGGTFIVGSGTNEVTAIRNVGGTIS